MHTFLLIIGAALLSIGFVGMVCCTCTIRPIIKAENMVGAAIVLGLFFLFLSRL
jgi:energy-converting hydrogenase Eha subunit E